MSRVTLFRLRKLEVKARLDCSVENLTDEQLFYAYRDLTERAGGAETLAAALRAEGEERLAGSVLALSACQTASDFMAVER
jgi:hypothetical protein